MALTTRLDLRQTLRQTQRLGLSSRVLGALAILRLPAADLAEHLAAEAAVNPFLLPGLPAAAPLPAAEIDPEGLGAAETSWQVRLLEQIALLAVPPGVARMAARLVGELDERGWLDVPLAEIAERDGLDPAELAAGLTALQSCDPAGVGARDLDECLRLQLIDRGLPEAEARATLAELPRFARRDWAGLGRALGLDPDGVQARAALLRGLAPRPVAAPDSPVPTLLRPDLVLVRNATGPDRVEPSADHTPRPRIDAALADRARAEGFGAEMLERARALLQAVDSRGSTLMRVGEWLVRRQESALRLGPGALKPASRVECAAELGLHPSTVGRTVAGKALMADGRLWRLESLFSGPGPAEGGLAARAIAHRIAALVAAEPAGRPWSDAALAQALGAEGVDIARRTVAKYRNGLRIPPAHRRRTMRRSAPSQGG
jgi:RNA polymerase sigma-54 factor